MKEEELKSLIKRQVPSFEAHDPLIEVNLKTRNEPETIKVSGLLAKGDHNRLINVIKQYKDYFAWDNCEMPMLSRELVKASNPISSHHLDSI